MTDDARAHDAAASVTVPGAGSDAAAGAAGADAPRNPRRSAATPGTATPACRAVGLTVAYRAEPVLRDVHLDVPEGVVMGVVGPNGAGKSTLIKAMLGLVTPLAGHAEFFGGRLRDNRLRVGYMPQSAGVDWDFPATVHDVVTMGTFGALGLFRRPGRRQRAAADDALELTGITDLAGRQIGELSGGQRQRVFLARALVQEPDLYFMDEPFQGVDARSQDAIVAVLHRLRAAGRTVVMVHHDLATVRRYCDHVTLINRGVVASGPAAESFTAANIRATYGIGDNSDSTFLEAVL